MQEYDRNGNRCIDPDCATFYLYEFDADKRTCTLSSTFHGIASVLAIAFVVVEVLVYEAAAYLGRKSVNNIDDL
jgi:hypothetical protein